MLLNGDVAELDPRQLESLQALLDEWARLWCVPDLAKGVGVRASGRMRRTLGNYRAARRQITLAAWLFDPIQRTLLEEVLCHEAAHAAVHLAHSGPGRSRSPMSRAAESGARDGKAASGLVAKVRAQLSRLAPRPRRRAAPRIRPHGPEWRAFMEAAGYTPRVRIPESAMPTGLRAEWAEKARSRKWEHRCPVCQVRRIARTRVTRWRCKRCVEAGRGGRLVIERVGAPKKIDE